MTQDRRRKAYLVGGGIASFAAAVYLIRDGGMAGEDIFVLEESKVLGGSLDGAGNADQGYVIRGGRMLTYEAYSCTFDLLASIPSLSDPDTSVSDEIHVFNEEHRSHAQARLMRNREKVDVSTLSLTNRDRLDMVKLMLASEETLGRTRIEDHFAPEFFKTNFWLMWCTTFAFQPWHGAVECKRYMLRFIQEFPRLATLGGVKRTPYNQYDSIVAPVTRWLKARDVRFELDTRVTDLDFVHGAKGQAVERIHCISGDKTAEIIVKPDDLVFVTNGSMTAGSRLGSMTVPATLGSAADGGAWTLWETLAQKHPDFGNPHAFYGNVAESKWLSFTVTLRDPAFFAAMEAFSGNKAGTGALVTFTDSNWLMSVVLAHQPHFINQPSDSFVFWGYGLFPEEKGNFVGKKMADCTGADILAELRGHLPFDAQASLNDATSNCIPCMMPFITAEFMPRVAGDRPPVRPTGTSNLAFIGQFCEMEDDVVFTVEYSVRSAQTAVYSLLNLDRPVPALYKGQHDPRVLLAAFEAMMR